MDPLSALVGGGAALAGSLINSSSQQSINSSNLAHSIDVEKGAYLPNYLLNLVSGAKGAGLNPLAVLGVSSPGFAGSAQPTNPGSGLEQMGKMLAEAGLSDHEEKMRAYAERRAETDIQLGNAQITNAMIDGAVRRYTLDFLNNHPGVYPEGAQQPTVAGQGVDALNDFNKRFGDWGHTFADWMKNVPQWNFNTP